MNINYLRYALEVHQAGSITQAAENLFMSQPNLSRDIKELEESLNIHLFSRTSRGVITTPEGEEFLEHARRLLGQMDAMEARYSRSNRQRMTFSISIPRSSYIAEAISRFVNQIDHRLGDHYIVSVKETNTIEAATNITDHGYDFGVIRYPVMYESYFHTLLEGKQLKYIDLISLNYVIITSEDGKLAKKKTCTLEELRHYIEIVHGDLTVPYLTLAHNIQDLTPTQNAPRKLAVFERGSQFNLLKNVKESYMWSSPMLKEDLEHNRLVVVECPEADDEYRDALIYQPKKEEDELGRHIIQELSDTICSTFQHTYPKCDNRA